MTMNPEDFGATVRGICQAIGGVLMAQGVTTESNVALVTGVVVSIASLVWSIWQKRVAAQKLVVAKAAPAEV